METPTNSLGIVDSKFFLTLEIASDPISTTYSGTEFSSQKEYIIKVFNKKNKMVEQEIKMNEIVSNSRNPSFLKYVLSSSGALVTDESNEYSYKPYIVSEKPTKGSLLDYLNNYNPTLNEKICKFIFFQILKSVQILHKIGICHRNLKLQNILFDGDNFKIKIGDFSKSFHLEDQKKFTTRRGKSFCGEKADIFDLGVLLLSLVTGKSIVVQNNSRKFLENYWKILEINSGNKKLSCEFKDLCSKMLAISSKERLDSIEEVLNHEWLKDIKELNEDQIKEYEREMINELESKKI